MQQDLAVTNQGVQRGHNEQWYEPVVLQPGEPGYWNPNLLFLRRHFKTARVIALQGSARSGKTFAVLQFLISLMYYYSGLIISVVRNGMPALRATALRDYKEILGSADLYDENDESKPSGYCEYQMNGNVCEFFSVDNPQKVRGRKRHILYINEANELSHEQYRQLAMRTEGLIIIDYNPSDPESYIYDHVLTRSDCQMLITTYKDNPHLAPAIVEEIELLKDADPEYYKVFGQGVRGNVSGVIYGHYIILPADEWPVGKGVKVYGIDFGFSAPSALVEVTIYDEAIYARLIVYKRKLTNPMLISEVKATLPDMKATFFCDAAEPDRIEEFVKAGFLAVAADKTIKPGLDSIRRRKLYIHMQSLELLTEIKGYRYKKNPVTGENTEEPIGIDHALDALRYAVYNHFKQPAPPQQQASRPQGKKPMSL